MKLKEKVLNTKHYAVNVKETPEGIIIDVFHRHGELIDTYTYWNDDVSDCVKCDCCGDLIESEDSIQTIEGDILCQACDSKRLEKIN